MAPNITKKDRHPNIYTLRDKSTTTHSLAKGTNLELIKPIDSATCLQEKHSNMLNCTSLQSAKFGPWETLQVNDLGSLMNNFKENRKVKEESVAEKRLKKTCQI